MKVQKAYRAGTGTGSDAKRERAERRERDLNPRTLACCWFSRPVPSATRPSLRTGAVTAPRWSTYTTQWLPSSACRRQARNGPGGQLQAFSKRDLQLSRTGDDVGKSPNRPSPQDACVSLQTRQQQQPGGRREGERSSRLDLREGSPALECPPWRKLGK